MLKSAPRAGRRLAAIAPENRTPEQEAAVQRLIATPRGAIRGPFEVLLHSPELLDKTQALGEFLRYRCSIPEPLRELAILVTARFWNQTYEWGMHAPLALKAGVAKEVVNAIGNATAMPKMASEETIIVRFCTSVHKERSVPDELYEQAQALFGDAGVAELIGLCGYYALLAMMMNVARTPLPEAAEAPFSPPEGT